MRQLSSSQQGEFYFYNQMGSQASVVVFDVTEWEQIGQTRFCTLIRHKVTHEQLEKYTINLSSSLNERDAQIYKARKNNLNGWVPILYHFRQPNSGLCGGRNYCVITERFTRLSEIKRKFTQSEGLQMLSEALHGYSTLVSQFGYFNITAGTMALDAKARLKVWFNENFASNQKTFDQQEKLDCWTLISSIVKAIASHVDCPNFPHIFEKHREPKFNFASALSILADHKLQKFTIEKKQFLRIQGRHTNQLPIRNRISMPISSKRECQKQFEKESQKNACKRIEKTQSASQIRKEFAKVLKSQYVVSEISPESKQTYVKPGNNKSMVNLENNKTTSICVLQPSQSNLKFKRQETLAKVFGKQNNFYKKKSLSTHQGSIREFHSPHLEQKSEVIEQEESNEISSQSKYCSNQGKLSTEQTKSRERSGQGSICSKLQSRAVEQSLSRSSQLRSQRHLFTRRSGIPEYSEIKRIDSVLLLGVAEPIASSQQKVVTIESTILRS